MSNAGTLGPATTLRHILSTRIGDFKKFLKLQGRLDLILTQSQINTRSENFVEGAGVTFYEFGHGEDDEFGHGEDDDEDLDHSDLDGEELDEDFDIDELAAREGGSSDGSHQEDVSASDCDDLPGPFG
jgi:hypothetical protein